MVIGAGQFFRLYLPLALKRHTLNYSRERLNLAPVETLKGGQMKLYFQREDANYIVIKRIHFVELHPPWRHKASSQPTYYIVLEKVSLLSETLSVPPHSPQKG